MRDNYLAPIAELFDRFEAMPYPIIAAINGYALGGGGEMALSCDLRLLADTAKIGLPETKIGAIPGAGGVQKLHRLVGRSKALEWILLSRHVEAAEALHYGFANGVHKPEALDQAALDPRPQPAPAEPRGDRASQGVDPRLRRRRPRQRTALRSRNPDQPDRRPRLDRGHGRLPGKAAAQLRLNGSAMEPSGDDPAGAHHHRNAVIASICAHAWDRAEEPTARLREAGFVPGNWPDWAALAALPVLDKSKLATLQEAAPPFGGTAPPTTGSGCLFLSPGDIMEPDLPAAEARLAAFFRRSGLGPDDVVLNGFSYHLTPAGLLFHNALLQAGCRVLPAGPQNTDAALTLAARAGATGFVGITSHLKLLFARAEERGMDLKLRIAFAGGEPFGGPIRAELAARHGVTCLDFYGSADLGVVAGERAGQPGFVLFHGVVAEILDPATNTRLSAGEPGHLVLSVDNPNYPMLRLGTGDIAALAPDGTPARPLWPRRQFRPRPRPAALRTPSHHVPRRPSFNHSRPRHRHPQPGPRRARGHPGGRPADRLAASRRRLPSRVPHRLPALPRRHPPRQLPAAGSRPAGRAQMPPGPCSKSNRSASASA